MKFWLEQDPLPACLSLLCSQGHGSFLLDQVLKTRNGYNLGIEGMPKTFHKSKVCKKKKKSINI